jgi:hypothetical protein
LLAAFLNFTPIITLCQTLTSHNSAAKNSLVAPKQYRFIGRVRGGDMQGSGFKRSLAERRKRQSDLLSRRLSIVATPQAASFASSTPTYPGLEFRDAAPGGMVPTSVVTGDFNQDGHMDYVVANGYTDDLWIYFGKGNGTFQLPRIIPLTQGLSPIFLVTCSLRANGVLDLIVANFDSSSIGVLLNNGDGTFGYEDSYGLPQPPEALVIDDFNYDGKADVLAVMYTMYPPGSSVPYIAFLPGDGKGKLLSPIVTNNVGFYSTAWSVVSGDVNSDTYPDLVITGPGLDDSYVYVNQKNGTFRRGAYLAGNGRFNSLRDAGLADVNEDGCLDVLIADANSYVKVLDGDCSGGFGNYRFVRMGDANAAIRMADLNNDGHLDIVTSAVPAGDLAYGDIAGDMVSVALGDGKGGFSNARIYRGNGPSYSLAVADFNLDGKLDVVTANSDFDLTTVFLNDGYAGLGFPQGINLAPSKDGALNTPLTSPSFVDFNYDGKTDIGLIVRDGALNTPAVEALLNDGTGRFLDPIITDTGQASLHIDDFRFADFRKTGHHDLVAVGRDIYSPENSEQVLFMPGNLDGTFGAATVTRMQGASGLITVGDYNQDGKLDFVAIAAGSSTKVLTVYLGTGLGTFTSGMPANFVAPGLPVRSFTGDFNRDGKPDVLVYCTENGDWTQNTSVIEFLGNGDGTVQAAQVLFNPFQRFGMGDVNNDGFSDLVTYDHMWPDGLTQTYQPPRVTSYIAQNNGTFTKANSYRPYSGIPIPIAPYVQDGDPAALSFLGDINGDGFLDAIAFQQASPANAYSYAQILMGTGNGAFLPTYNVFDLQKEASHPNYAHDLNGDGRTDFVELDGMQSSIHVIRSIPAPRLQIALDGEKFTEGGGCGYVFPNVPPSSNATVQLTSSISGVMLPSSVEIAAGALSARFCFTLASTFDRMQVFDIRAQLGSDEAIAYASGTNTVGFSEQIAPAADQVVYATHSTHPVTVTITAEPGYSTTVTLSCIGLTAEESCTFGSKTLAVAPGATMSTSVVVNTGSHSSSSTIYILATDGKVTRRQSLRVNVQGLAIQVDNFEAIAGETGRTNLTIIGIPPYAPSCSGLPTGITCSFSGEQLPYPSTTNLILVATVEPSVAAGQYPFTVAVTSDGITTQSAVTLTVKPASDFRIEPPSSLFTVPGGTVQGSVNLVGNETFHDQVTFTCTADWGNGCSADGRMIDYGNNTVWLHIQAPTGASTGLHSITLTATGGGQTRTAQIPTYISEYSGKPGTQQLTLQNGQEGSVDVTLTATEGFNSQVQVLCSSSSVLSCSSNPGIISLTSASPQIVRVTIRQALTAGVTPATSSTSCMILVSILCAPIFLIVAGCSKRLHRSMLLLALCISIFTILWACGGGGGSGTRNPSSSYSLEISATALNTSTTRSVGSVTVTVAH